uniref:Uncharacterized protein n=1 Tax=Oryza sativa subsp. japonica TaxID=39947 RepID=Q69TT9_ORYSJ|nr:hypothetical protein [Oryza sativa Japonica Group]
MKRMSGSNATRNRIRRRREFDSHDGGEWKVTSQRWRWLNSGNIAATQRWRGGAPVAPDCTKGRAGAARRRWRGVVAAHWVAGHGRRGHAKVETEGTRCAVAAG